MKSNNPICIIGGYDPISSSFFKVINKNILKSIFINLNEIKINKKNIYNVKIYQLKKIFEILNKRQIYSIVFLGKINRPNLIDFEYDGVIDKYIPDLYKSFKIGDAHILKSVINIFKKNNFKVMDPYNLSKEFFFAKNELIFKSNESNKSDIIKAKKMLNDLAKYDNAQSAVCVNGHIIAIEAAEGTDEMLIRTIAVRKKLGQINFKSGLLVKIPKKSQSKLIDLPVVGPKTIKLLKDANLDGMAISRRFTMIQDKLKTLKLLKDYNLKIFDLT